MRWGAGEGHYMDDDPAVVCRLVFGDFHACELDFGHFCGGGVLSKVLFKVLFKVLSRRRVERWELVVKEVLFKPVLFPWDRNFP